MVERFINLGDSEKQALGLLPGRHVSSFCLTLPALPPSKLERALPHIMSDYLTADSSDMVFCHSPAQDGQHIVFACSRDTLDDLMDEARARNLELLGIWPDYMTVGKPSDGIAVLEDGNDILARRADGSGFRLPKHLAASLLNDSKTHPGRADALPTQEAGFAIGRYGAQLPLGALVQNWRRPLILMAAALLVWLGAGLLDAFNSERHRANMEAQAEARFMKLFPDTRRFVNLEAQLRNKLGMSGSASFSGQTTRLMATLAALPNMRLEEIEFDAERAQGLEVTVSTTDFSALEAGRLRLMQAGFRVTEGTSEQDENLVIGRFNLGLTRRTGAR
ncbi:MAG: Type II secretion system protein L [Alphaproteobacteria bacterium]|nr:MAG: Type II secretion system protein L [Alphaproteobacteria bacterium]